MNIQALSKSARLYARAEAMAAGIRLRLLMRKLILVLSATSIAVLGLVLINLGIFRGLETVWGPVWTPLALGFGNLLLAAVIFLMAAFLKPGRDLAMAEDLSKLAAQAVEDDLAGPGVGHTLAGLLSASSAETSTARLLVPVVATIIQAMRRKKSKDGT